MKKRSIILILFLTMFGSNLLGGTWSYKRFTRQYNRAKTTDRRDFVNENWKNLSDEAKKEVQKNLGIYQFLERGKKDAFEEELRGVEGPAPEVEPAREEVGPAAEEVIPAEIATPYLDVWKNAPLRGWLGFRTQEQSRIELIKGWIDSDNHEDYIAAALELDGAENFREIITNLEKAGTAVGWFKREVGKENFVRTNKDKNLLSPLQQNEFDAIANEIAEAARREAEEAEEAPEVIEVIVAPEPEPEVEVDVEEVVVAPQTFAQKLETADNDVVLATIAVEEWNAVDDPEQFIKARVADKTVIIENSMPKAYDDFLENNADKEYIKQYEILMGRGEEELGFE